MNPAIICATHVIGLAVIRSLGEKGVPVYALYYDPCDMGYVSRYVKKAFRVSRPVENEAAFIQDILDLDDDATGGLVIPGDDATVSAIARNKHLLQQRFAVAVSSEQVMERFINKSYTYSIAACLGIPIPGTFPVTTEAEALAVASDMFPCIVKPCRSHLYYAKFHKKMTLVKSETELLRALAEARSASLDVMIQEYVEGEDTCGYNYNSYFVDGKPVAEFTAQKIRLSPPRFGVPSAVEAKVVPEIVTNGRAILTALGYEGYSCTEFKYDLRTGQYKFMEVNGRHNRSGLLAVRCGLNFPWMEYQHLMHGEIPSSNCLPMAHKIWIDEFKDTATGFRQMIHGKLSPKSFVAPYLADPVFAVFDAHDMRPFFKRVSGLARTLWNSQS